MVGNILDGIEALAALEQCGTISETATRLRLTQSAVSKRIQALQKTMGFRIVEPDGRRVKLTSEAVNLVERRVSLSTRKTVNQLASFQRLRDGIVRAARRYFARASNPPGSPPA